MSLYSGFAVTPADVEKWESEMRELGVQLEQLHKRRALLKKRVEAAAALFSLLENDGPGIVPEVGSINAEERDGKRVISHPPPSGYAISADSTFVDAVLRIVDACQFGIALPDIRQAILDSALGDRFRTSEKGYYHAISRLQKRGILFRKNGRMFSQAALARLAQLEAKGWVDEPPIHSSRSPMNDAIITLVTKEPGLMPGEVVRRLQEDPRFSQMLNPRNTSAYNAIARLVEDAQITKRDGLLHPISNDTDGE